MSSASQVDPLISRSQALLAQGRAADVVQQLQTVCTDACQNPAYWFFYGAALAESGNLRGAVRAFEQSLQLSPDNIAALTNLGRAFNVLQQYKQAVDVLTKALSLQADHLPAVRLLVNAHIALQQADRAVPLCEQLYRALPTDVEVLTQCGMVRQIQNKTDEAIAFFDQALALNSNAVPVLMNKGLALKAAGQIDEALAIFEKAAGLAPGNANVWHILAMAWLAKARLPKVIECFEKAFALDPANTDSGIQLAKALRHAGRTEDCEQVCKKILEVEPDNAEAKFFQDAYSRQKNKETLERIPAEVTRQMYKGHDGETSLGKKFDNSLKNSLQYRAPAVLNTAVREALDENNPGEDKEKIDILELGCGSGLCGSQFADIAGRLIGSDISPDMLEGAKEKNAYTELYEADLVDALDRYHDNVDLVIAMDVLCFFGDLTSIFQRCHTALRKNGLFGFSVVKPKTDAVWELQPYGHFVHSLQHLEEAAAASGFKRLFAEELPLRKELNEDQYGYVCVYQRDAL